MGQELLCYSAGPVTLALRPRFTGDRTEQGETQPFELIAALGFYPVVAAAVYKAVSGDITVGEKALGALAAEVFTGQVLAQQSLYLLLHAPP